MTNKEKYEQLILASPLFSLDKEKECVAYKREALKMVEYLYLYLLEINEEKYIEYGLEITETANKCIANFDVSNGNFLHYFNSAMAKEYRRASAKKQIEEARCGIHITDDDDRNIRKLLRFMESRGITNPNDVQISLMAESIGISEQSVREYILMNSNSYTLSDTTINEDGEEISLFDTVASTDENYVDIAEQSDNSVDLLRKIETAYLLCQERQKPIISAMMTIKVCKIVCEYKISLDGLSFINKEIITQFIRTGILPTQREVAQKFDKNEASISRTIATFTDKINGVH
jgi:hypothetical protein